MRRAAIRRLASVRSGERWYGSKRSDGEVVAVCGCAGRCAQQMLSREHAEVMRNAMGDMGNQNEPWTTVDWMLDIMPCAH